MLDKQNKLSDQGDSRAIKRTRRAVRAIDAHNGVAGIDPATPFVRTAGTFCELNNFPTPSKEPCCGQRYDDSFWHFPEPLFSFPQVTPKSPTIAVLWPNHGDFPAYHVTQRATRFRVRICRHRRP